MENLKKLQSLLKEVFQFNTSLDFWIYKIYQLKQQELISFIWWYVLYDSKNKKNIQLEDWMIFEDQEENKFFYRKRTDENNQFEIGVFENEEQESLEKSLKNLKRIDIKNDNWEYKIIFQEWKILEVIENAFQNIKDNSNDDDKNNVLDILSDNLAPKKYKDFKSLELWELKSKKSLFIDILEWEEREKVERILNKVQQKSKNELYNEIYNHVFNFFSLYYASWDFAFNEKSWDSYKLSISKNVKELLKEKVEKLWDFEKGTEEYEEINTEIMNLLESSNTSDICLNNTDYNWNDVFFTWKFKDCYYVKTSSDYKNYKTLEENVGYDWKQKTFSINIDLKESEEWEKNNNKSDKKTTYVLKNVDIKENEDDYKIFLDFWKNLETKNTTKKEILNKIIEKFSEKWIKFSDTENFLDSFFSSKNKDWIVKDNEKSKDYKKKNTQNDYIKNYNKWIKKREDKIISFWEIKDKQFLYKLSYRLEQALYGFISSNENDVFIHKDLEWFLTKEKNFYINTKIIKDLTEYNEENSLLAKTFNEIVSEIIVFLSKIENFQKRIFEMKKYVLEDNYCFTLDKIDETIKEEVYAEILANWEQLKEWWEEKLAFIKEWENVDEKYLENNQTLVVDTKFFNEDFKYKIISKIENLEEELNWLLINSENFQALNRLLNKYRWKVKCIYIDPPYNTWSDGFIYKDSFKHSSWLSMMENRLSLAKEFLSDDWVIFVNIWEEENTNLEKLLIQIFWEENYISNITRVQKAWWRKWTYFSPSIDYIHVISKNINNLEWFDEWVDISLYPKTEIEWPYKWEKYRDDQAFYLSSLDSLRWCKNQRYYIKCPDWSFVIPPWNVFPNNKNDWKTVLPETSEDKVWRWAIDSYEKDKDLLIFNKTTNSPLLDENWKQSKYNVYVKSYLHLRKKDWTVPRNFIADLQNRKWTSTLKKLWIKFPYSKPHELIQYLLDIIKSDSNSIVLDFFAWSWTTQQAVIEYNIEEIIRIEKDIKEEKKKDNKSSKNNIFELEKKLLLAWKRKYIWIEMWEYFDKITKPRINKVVYSQNWKNWLPLDNKWISQIFKYQKLEQYEDKLNNIIKQSESLKSENINFIREYNKYFNSLDLEKPFENEMNIDSKWLNKAKIDLFNTYLYNFKITNYINQYSFDWKKYRVAINNSWDNLVIFRNIENNENWLKKDFENITEILKKEEIQKYINWKQNINIHLNSVVYKGKNDIQIWDTNIKINFKYITNNNFIK